MRGLVPPPLRRALGGRVATEVSDWLSRWIASDAVRRGGITLDLSDPAVSPETRVRVRLGFYEATELRLLSRHLPSHLDTVEFGASVGVVSSHIASRLDRGRRLVCVEANDVLLPALRSNLSSNGSSLDWSVIHGAVDYGPAAEEAVFVAAGDTTAGRVASNGAPGPRVSRTTLAQVVADLPRYALVMDIEGSEAGIIVEDHEALRRCEFLLAELHDWEHAGRRGNASDLRDQLVEQGFEVVGEEGDVVACRRRGATSGSPPLSVAVVVPVRNERRRLPGLIGVIEGQSLSPVQVVVADGSSTDGSREWLEEASQSRPWLRVVDNPTRIIPDAMNRAVGATDADILARMDAHADYAADYLERLVNVLATHVELAGAGGAMRTAGRGPWGSAIAAVLRSRWGLGGAPHRVGGAGGPVDHTFCTAYRRSAVVAAGGWDRHLLANEDVELDFRLKAASGPIWLVPSATSTWWTRETPAALARQMWRYGFYRARTAHLHPRTIKARHLAPVAVVSAIPALALIHPRRGVAAALGYLAGAAWMGASAARGSGASRARAAAVVPVVHLSWGAGMAAGLVLHAGARPAPGLAGSAPDLPSVAHAPREALPSG